MPLAVRLEYLAPQVILVGSRHPRLRRRVSPSLHYTIIGIALDCLAKFNQAICAHPPEKVKVAMPTAYQSNRRVVGLCYSMR